MFAGVTTYIQQLITRFESDEHTDEDEHDVIGLRQEAVNQIVTLLKNNSVRDP